MPFGHQPAMDSDGNLYFCGAQGGIFRMAPKGQPDRISHNTIDERTKTLDLSVTMATAVYDEELQSIHFFYTALDGSASEHFTFDLRNKAFWPFSFTDADHNPVSTHVFDGDAAGDRKVFLGGIDGYIRYFDSTVSQDDTNDIDSYVYIGPMMGKGGAKIEIQELSARLSDNTNAAEYEVYTGANAEHAFVKTIPDYKGVWENGRNYPDIEKRQGHALYVKVKGTCGGHWSLEELDALFLRYDDYESRRFDFVGNT
jgi:hypothetical protein